MVWSTYSCIKSWRRNCNSLEQIQTTMKIHVICSASQVLEKILASSAVTLHCTVYTIGLVMMVRHPDTQTTKQMLQPYQPNHYRLCKMLMGYCYLYIFIVSCVSLCLYIQFLCNIQFKTNHKCCLNIYPCTEIWSYVFLLCMTYNL